MTSRFRSRMPLRSMVPTAEVCRACRAPWTPVVTPEAIEPDVRTGRSARAARAASSMSGIGRIAERERSPRASARCRSSLPVSSASRPCSIAQAIVARLSAGATPRPR